MRKRENKNCHSVPTPRVIENSKKIAKNIQKIKKYHYGIISTRNRLENAKKERIQKVSFRFVSTRREIENSKKFKILKNAITTSFQAKIGWKMPRKRKNKNYRSVPFLHDAK